MAGEGGYYIRDSRGVPVPKISQKEINVKSWCFRKISSTVVLMVDKRMKETESEVPFGACFSGST